MRSTKQIDEAYKIALADLRSCYSENGILAGRGKFSDYWARDSFFASFGSLEAGDFDIVKKNLSLFLEYTKDDGTVPLRVGTYHLFPKIMKNTFGLKFKGKGMVRINEKVEKIEEDFEKRIRARYVNDRNKNFPIDSNSLILVSFYYYLKKTNDKKFAKKHFPLLKKILEKSFDHDRNFDLLLENVHGSSWDDSLNIRGESIYVNVCHVASVRSIWKIAEIIGHRDAEKYKEIYEKAKERINGLLWNGKFYSNFVWNNQRLNIFSMAGNVLAIHWHIANLEKSLSIEDTIKEREISKFVPSLTNSPKYTNEFISGVFKIAGMKDYHNMGMCWLWLGAEDAMVKYKLGMKKDAMEVMEKMAKVITKYNSVYEVYEKNGEPVNRWFYRSEASFAWSSGLFVMAYNTIFSNKKSVLNWKID